MRRKKIDFDAIFNEFIHDIRSLFTLQSLDQIRGMRLYEYVYAMCNTYPRPMHEDLFLRLADFFNKHTSEIALQIKDASNILKEYAKEWDYFQAAVTSTNIICDYLNKVLCAPFREIKMSSGLMIATEPTHVIQNSPYDRQKIDQLAYSLWRVNVFDYLKQSLISRAMETIRLDRQDQSGVGEFGHEACKTLVMSLVVLCFQEENKMDLYLKEYESAFLSATKQFYQEESQRYATTLTVTEFMRMAILRLNQEGVRARRYLHPASVDKVLFECSTIYIANHSSIIQSSFFEMLMQQKKEDCELAYRLLSSIPEGVHLLTSIYEKFVGDEGKRFLSQDPKQLVEDLGAFQQARSNEIAKWFQMDSAFVASLDKAFRSLVNGSTTKFSELLTKYCDWLLKKNTKLTEKNIDKQLGIVILLFNYIDDKDVFQKFYSRYLAKRLIQKSSISNEMEYLMLAKLKLACGVEYTSKLQRMFTDVNLSQELSSVFNESRSEMTEFCPLVLTAGAWPVTHMSTTQFLSLPSELEEKVTAFTNYYHSKHNGRKLTWLWHLCRVDVRVHGFDKRYEINMSLHHYILLAMLNHQTKISLAEVSKLLPMPASDFDKILQSLTEVQLIRVTSTDIELNMNFTCKRTKLKLSMASAYEPTTEYTEKSLNEDRGLFLQATIVRLMKSHRQMSHSDLITNVIQHSQTRFHPTMTMIKKCIEHLIEKQYIERAGNDHQTYIYMA